MYRLLTTAAICIAFLFTSPDIMAGVQADSSAIRVLGEKLDEYLAIIETEPASVKCEESDFLIGSCSDSLLRQYTAVRIYSHYLESDIMGDEAVAIHVYDSWFATGKVRMYSSTDFMNAGIFAEFNRSSLIGMKAPDLYMEDIQGKYTGLFGNGTFYGKPSVLFFYDSTCPTCRMDAIMLRSILRDSEYPVNLYAIYTRQSEEDWKKFTEEYLDIGNPRVTVTHLWDPEIKSGYQMKYGILQTPRIFLVSGNGTIIGRRLDILSLKRMLDLYCKPYEYGNEESSAFYDGLFGSPDKNPDCGTVRGICDSIAVRTVAKGDTLIFRQMTGDLMYWLGSHRGEGIKCGLEYLLDRYIDGMPEVWRNSADSLKILPYAGILKDLLERTPSGMKLPAFDVPGTVLTRKGRKEKIVRLDKLRSTTVVFHTGGCGFCEAELEAADSIATSDRRMKFFLVDMDAVLDTDPELGCMLFGEFDLTVMPFIITTDRKGRTERKYVSLY